MCIFKRSADVKLGERRLCSSGGQLLRKVRGNTSTGAYMNKNNKEGIQMEQLVQGSDGRWDDALSICVCLGISCDRARRPNKEAACYI